MNVIKAYPKFSILFGIVMFFELLGMTIIPSYHIVTKPFVMASLMGFYIVEEKQQNNIFILGLLFAMLGDIFLLFDTEDFFVIGLACFLIMQICYAIVFNKKRRIPKNQDYYVPIAIAIFAFLVLAFLWESLGALRIPVTIYVFSIAIMAIFGYLRHPKLIGYSTVLLGIILFMVSDTILGISKFYGDIPYSRLTIILTYMIGQYLIVTGEVASNPTNR